MYSEIQKSGMKQFLFALISGLAVSCVLGVINFFTRETPLLGHLITVIALSVLVYIVLFHYASTFEYKIEGYTLTVTRQAGRKTKVISVKSSQIKCVSAKKPKGIKTDKMCVAAFFPKNPLYISYGKRAVLIDASPELYEKLKNITNGVSKWQK